MAASAADPELPRTPNSVRLRRDFGRPGPQKARRKRGMRPQDCVGRCWRGSCSAGCFTGQRPSFEPTEPLPTRNGQRRHRRRAGAARLGERFGVHRRLRHPHQDGQRQLHGHRRPGATRSPIDHDQRRPLPLRRRRRRHVRSHDRRVRGDDQRRPREQRVDRPRVLRPELRPAPPRRRQPARRRTDRVHDHPGRPAGAVRRRAGHRRHRRPTARSRTAHWPDTTAPTCSSR